MSEVPPEPIQTPTHQDIESSALGILHELIQRWPAVLGP